MPQSRGLRRDEAGSWANSTAIWGRPAYEIAVAGNSWPCHLSCKHRSATDARIEELRFDFQDFLYRAPYKFGGKEVDRVTMLNVPCRVRTKAGKSAAGFASMPLGNVWSFPAPDVRTPTTLAAMKSLAKKIAQNHARVHGFRASAGGQSGAGAGISRAGGGSDARDAAAAADAEAVHAGDGEPVRRGHSRCIRKAARAQQLYGVRPRFRALRSSHII